jgi:DNA-binding NtrC family response regulator
MPGKVLIIDDEESLRKLTARIIRLEGYTVEEAGTLNAARSYLNLHSPDLILCDVKLPDGNGVEFVKEIKNRFPSIEVILLTAFGNIAGGVQAMKNGAFDYIVKGDDNDRILPLLRQATERAQKNKGAAVKISGESFANFESIIGSSAAIKRSIAFAQKISATDSPVLLLGNTGTGKEVFANAIHHNSNRRKKPMVAINCSAFNRELLEGELFGHQAGAYTGAVKDKKGLIEEAKELMQEEATPEVMDVALICAAQKVEHYEIAGYGCACTYARLLGMSDVEELLNATLDEEKSADEKLTSIASELNEEAMQPAGESEEEE